jgi:hypothetical protein
MAAGLGFKTFTTGEVLTAADTNGYLMQGVLVFASAAARDAAITSPQEGQCCYLKDTDAVLTYSGAAWVGFDDSNAIQNSIVDAKGDLVAASGADTPARLAVGSNGETLVADSSTSTGLRYQGNFAAGKNAIINGAYDWFQRGTTQALTNGVVAYLADRYQVSCSFTAGTSSVTQQTFTPGTAPVSGYEGTYFQRLTCGTTNSYFDWTQKIENVRTFAGQAVTLSFWAKASASINVNMLVRQNFGSGGSANVDTAKAITLTTSWTRYTFTIDPLGSMSGKTIGTNSYIFVGMYTTGTPASGLTVDSWGWQFEASAVATAFQTATGTLQGELAACQRYYWRTTGQAATINDIGGGTAYSTTSAVAIIKQPVQMRVAPTCAVSAAGDFSFVFSGGGATASAVAFDATMLESINFRMTTVGATTNAGGSIRIATGTTKWLEASAEL